MENPTREISPIIHALTQAVPSKQKQAVERYFTPNAAFTHPFCATGSWEIDLFGVQIPSRWAILQIYQWYKILSPQIDLEVLNVTFNEDKLILYVDIAQHFKLFLVPFYDANVHLTTVLQLAEGDESGPSSVLVKKFHSRYESPSQKPYSYAAVAAPRKENGSPKALYYITSQNDLYQTSEFIRFLLPFGIGSSLVIAWQLYATLLCVIGAAVLFPVTWYKEKSLADRPRRI